MLPRDNLLRIVVEDLHYLADDWDEEVDDASLRRSSTVLRRLLVDNELQRAWKAAGFEKEPQIAASTLQPVLNRWPLEKIIVAAAGGAKYRGMAVRGLVGLQGGMDQDEIQREYRDGLPAATFGLGSFIKAPCMVVAGVTIQRRVLIKYIANTQGGAHFDVKRDDKDGPLYRRLDSAKERMVIAGKPVVYFELLSAGQALAHAEDIGRLREKGKELLG